MFCFKRFLSHPIFDFPPFCLSPNCTNLSLRSQFRVVVCRLKPSWTWRRRFPSLCVFSNLPMQISGWPRRSRSIELQTSIASFRDAGCSSRLADVRAFWKVCTCCGLKCPSRSTSSRGRCGPNKRLKRHSTSNAHQSRALWATYYLSPLHNILSVSSMQFGHWKSSRTGSWRLTTYNPSWWMRFWSSALRRRSWGWSSAFKALPQIQEPSQVPSTWIPVKQKRPPRLWSPLEGWLLHLASKRVT